MTMLALMLFAPIPCAFAVFFGFIMNLAASGLESLFPKVKSLAKGTRFLGAMIGIAGFLYLMVWGIWFIYCGLTGNF